MELNTLQDLLADELKDLLSAENQLTRALPKMAKNAANAELQRAFTTHLEETKNHVQRLEQAMELLGMPAKSKKCKAMEGLLEEGKEIMEEDASPEVMDAAMIGAAQKVEHYEIAGYGTVCTYAELLGQKEVARLLKENLKEEKKTDELLTELANRLVNPKAAQNA